MSEETFIESTYIFDARLYELMRSLDGLFSAGSARYRERRDQMETEEGVTPEQFQQQVYATILFTSVIYMAQRMGLEIPKDLGEIVRDPLIKLN